MSLATKFSKLLLQAIKADSNTIADVNLTLKLVAGQTADLFNIVDSNGVVLYKVNAAGQPIATAAASLANPFGLGGGIKTARAKYDFAVDGGVIGLITLATTATLPDNAIVLGGMINPTTAPVGATATIAFGTSAGSSASSLKAATAIASYTLDALLAVVPLWTAATAFKMTAAGDITMTTATAALTAGVIEITIFYYVAAA